MKLTTYSFFCICFIFMSLWVSRKKFLMTLINLEILILSIFLLQVYFFNQKNVPMTPALFLLVMSACEASLGLCLLIQSTRFKGNDVLSKKDLKS